MLMQTQQLILIVLFFVLCVCVCEHISEESVQTQEPISGRFSESGSESNWPAINPLT